MSMSEKDNFAWKMYSLNVTLYPLGQETIYPFWAMIMVFGFLRAAAYAISVFVPLSLYGSP